MSTPSFRIATWLILIGGSLLGALTPAAAQGLGALQPYQPDQFTSALYHFDNSGRNAVNLPLDLNLNYGAEYEAASFPGLGSALNTYQIDYNFEQDCRGAYATQDVLISQLVGQDGAFTIEALIQPQIELNLLTQAHMVIASGENTDAAKRSFLFRLNTKGLLSFVNITEPVEYYSAMIPLSGPHAFQAQKWYHVAVVYDGNEGMPSNIKLYWTRLDSGAREANELTQRFTVADFASETFQPVAEFRMPADLNSQCETTLSVGNKARKMHNYNEPFMGLIDEVRISSIARQPREFLMSGITSAGTPATVPTTISTAPITVPVINNTVPTDRLFIFYKPGDRKSDQFTIALENSQMPVRFPDLKIEWIDAGKNYQLVKKYNIYILPTAAVEMLDGRNDTFVCYGQSAEDFMKWLGKYFISK
ncbi:hypothetical protein JXA32_03765 [Candidatus Sumerlaeota bacterium]|nr:hypothetical protein [Candidatus Sumerlaeota bacterium]